MDDTNRQRKFLRLTQLRAKLGGISRSSVYRLIASDRLPRPLKISPKISLWDEDAVNACLEQASQTGVANRG